MRVTVLGASGLLGQELVKELRGDELTALSSRDADLREATRVRDAVLSSRPDWIILSAAYTDVDGCESNHDRAFSVNCEGAINVAQAALEAKSRLLFISTDYVFDGSKREPYQTADQRNPTSVYGASKARAEERLQEFVPEVCIARTSWLFGHGGNVSRDHPELAAARPEISVVNDQRGSPTFSPISRPSSKALLRERPRHRARHQLRRLHVVSILLLESCANRLPTAVKPVTTADFHVQPSAPRTRCCRLTACTPTTSICRNGRMRCGAILQVRQIVPTSYRAAGLRLRVSFLKVVSPTQTDVRLQGHTDHPFERERIGWQRQGLSCLSCVAAGEQEVRSD